MQDINLLEVSEEDILQQQREQAGLEGLDDDLTSISDRHMSHHDTASSLHSRPSSLRHNVSFRSTTSSADSESWRGFQRNNRNYNSRTNIDSDGISQTTDKGTHESNTKSPYDMSESNLDLMYDDEEDRHDLFNCSRKFSFLLILFLIIAGVGAVCELFLPSLDFYNGAIILWMIWLDMVRQSRN